MPPQTITEFARQFGLSRATLLYYDRIGLLKPDNISVNGYRLYGEHERARMTRIDRYRKAGLPLKAIQEILDGKGGDALEEALEQQLARTNEEMQRLRAQQRLITELLHRRGKIPGGQVDVRQWVAMLEEAGVDAAGRQRWHAAFERDAPAAHQLFLESLGLDAEEIARVRARSRGQDYSDDTDASMDPGEARSKD